MTAAKSAPALPVAGKQALSPSKGAKKTTPEAASSSTAALQQRVTSHPRIAASPLKASTSALEEVTRACSLSDTTAGSVSSEQDIAKLETNALPVVASAQPVGDALLTHSLAGFIVAVVGETSLTAQSTAPQAVHLFYSALVFLLLGVCVSLMLDADADFTTPWSNMGLPADGLLTAATAGGMAAAAAFVATLAQRGVFAYARGVWAASKMGGVLRKWPVLRLAIGWLLNFGLYGAATAGAVLIAHYRLDTVQLTVGFSTRATMALIWNLCATELSARSSLPQSSAIATGAVGSRREFCFEAERSKKNRARAWPVSRAVPLTRGGGAPGLCSLFLSSLIPYRMPKHVLHVDLRANCYLEMRKLTNRFAVRKSVP